MPVLIGAFWVSTCFSTGPTKAFEVSWTNQLWMTDGMWGPMVSVASGGKPVRSHLLEERGHPTIYCNSGNLNPMTKTFIGKYLERYPTKSEKPTPGPSVPCFRWVSPCFPGYKKC
jgi:hypothetical protein